MLGVLCSNVIFFFKVLYVFYFKKMPSHAISIRAIDTVKYKVIDMQKNEVLEEIEESKAFFQVV